MRRGPSTPKMTPPSLTERVREGLPDLPTMMTSSFLLRFASEGSSRQLKAFQERIKRALLPEDIRVFEQTDPEGLIG